MLADTIERVNKLRKQALNNPEFIRSSKEHERTLALSQRCRQTSSSHKAKKQKRFDEVYRQSEFDVNPSGLKH